MNPTDALFPRKHLLRLGACAAAIALGSGCGSTFPDVAQRTLDWTAAAEARLSLFVLIQSGGASSTSAEDFAKVSSDDVVARLGTCAKAAVDGTRVTYTFSGCEGAWGITGLTGTVEATYRFVTGYDPGDFIEAEMSGKDVSINGVTMTFAMTGANKVSRGFWQSQPEAPFQVEVEETELPAADADPVDLFNALSGDFHNTDCKDGGNSAPMLLGGNGVVVVDGAQWTTDVRSPYHRCDGGCPMNGGSIGVRGDYSASVSFDGSASATGKDGRNGETSSLPLTCSP